MDQASPQGFGGGAAAVIVAVFAVFVWRGAPWLDASRLKRLTPVQQESAIDAIRGRMIQIGAGLLASGALVYTALNFRLSRESHVTDRYTKAIEQLGSNAVDVRLGAIYALKRIMIDSPRDHPTIVEVLAAFIREHSRPFMESKRESGPEPERSRNPATFKDASTDGQCCVGRSARMTGRADENDRLSDGRRKLVEGCAEPVAGEDAGGEFIVAAAEILHEGVAGGQDPC